MKNISSLLGIHYDGNLVISRFITRLQRDFSPTHKKSLEHAIGLAYYFYVQSDEEITRKIIKIMAEIPFDGDYDHWTWVCDALALYARISRMDGDVKKNENLVNKIWGAFEFGDQEMQKVNKKIFIRSLKGINIPFDKLKVSIDSGNIISEINYRFSCLRECILIREVGASEVYTIEQAEKDIENNIISIKELLDLVDVKKILPFSDM
ncbi:TPA: hypothetical protein N2G30_004335 [Salmonella enterica]|nr:hypothetical protein [Salmonella enterica]